MRIGIAYLFHPRCNLTLSKPRYECNHKHEQFAFNLPTSKVKTLIIKFVMFNIIKLLLACINWADLGRQCPLKFFYGYTQVLYRITICMCVSVCVCMYVYICVCMCMLVHMCVLCVCMCIMCMRMQGVYVCVFCRSITGVATAVRPKFADYIQKLTVQFCHLDMVIVLIKKLNKNHCSKICSYV